MASTRSCRARSRSRRRSRRSGMDCASSGWRIPTAITGSSICPLARRHKAQLTAKLDPHKQAAAAIEHLQRDRVVSGLIEQYGPVHLTRTDDYFFTLVQSIASQQISSKAADSIIARIRALVPGKDKIEAEDLVAVPDQAL